MCILNTIPCCSEYTAILCGCTIDLSQEMLLSMSCDLYHTYLMLEDLEESPIFRKMATLGPQAMLLRMYVA